MRRTGLSLLLLACSLLSACQTMTPEERRAADERRCMSYGFRPGTDGMAGCLQRADLSREARMEEDQRDMMRDLDWRMRRPTYVIVREAHRAP